MMIFKKKEKATEKKEDDVLSSGKEKTIENDSNQVKIVISNETLSPAKEDKKTSVFKWFFRVLTLLLVIFLLVWSVISFVTLFKRTSRNDNSFILLDGKNQKQTTQILNAFGYDEPQLSKKRKIKDFYLIGSQFFASEVSLSPAVFSNPSAVAGNNADQLSLYNLSDDVSYSVKSSTHFADKKYSIDFSLLDDGDYLLYSKGASVLTSKSSIYPYSIDSDETISLSGYTLPDRDGARKRITVKNNTNSPYTILSVFKAGSTLPSNVYDVVIYPAYYSKNLEKAPSPSLEEMNTLLSQMKQDKTQIDIDKYSIRVCNDIFEAKKTNASISVAVSLENDMSFCSAYYSGFYPSFATKTLSDSPLIGYDYYPDIREMHGMISKASFSYPGVVGNNLFPVDLSRTGKESFLISKNIFIDKVTDVLKSKL
ncbi:MAG: hypothetical protein MR497_02720 [Bacilli bacterium]|nr:hypothetical protein [Bacilli bacterium]